LRRRHESGGTAGAGRAGDCGRVAAGGDPVRSTQAAKYGRQNLEAARVILENPAASIPPLVDWAQRVLENAEDDPNQGGLFEDGSGRSKGSKQQLLFDLRN